MPPPYPPGSYAALVVADGASHYWRLDETSGTTAVDVIGGANGTISGGVTLNQPGAVTDPPPPPPTTARSNKARAGAARSGYLLPETAPPKIPAIVIDGALTGAGAARRVLIDSLTIHDQLNEVPNTCTFTVQGDRPVEGTEIVIAYGTPANTVRLFAGTILRGTQIYVAQKPTNVLWQVEAIDYTWALNRRLVIAQYTNQSASAIAADLVATWAPPGGGFTTAIEAGLPVLDQISFTNTPLMEALTQLATRIGGYAECDYFKAIALWVTPTGVPPQDLTPGHGSLQEFQVTRDLSQVVTRALVEGGGVTALAAIPPGATRIPVQDTAWYEAGGGLVVPPTPQRIRYGALVPGGAGALVGPRAATAANPSGAMTATKSQSGSQVLPAGTYKYAYTWMLSTGESSPSPLLSVTGGTTSASAALTNPALPAQMSNAGAGSPITTAPYQGKYAFTNDAAIGSAVAPTRLTTPSPASAGYTYPVIMSAGHAAIAVNVPSQVLPTGITGIAYYMTTAGGSTFYHIGTALQGDSFANQYTDAQLATRPAAPSSNTTAVPTTQYDQWSLGGIAPGPTGTTARKVYRTTAGGSALLLHTTINDNTTTTLGTDNKADGALGAAPSVPATPTQQVNAGDTVIPVSSVAPFGTSGWALCGSQVIRYTGASATALTGVPAAGDGSVLTTIPFDTPILVAPQLIQIPTAGAGAIVYPILPGDTLNLLTITDDLAAQAALAAVLGGDGVVEEYQQDNRISADEARARAAALLELKGPILETYHYRSRDPRTKSGRTITVNLPAPTNVSGTFEIQDVTIGGFLGTEEYPFYDAVASSRRFTFEDLLRRRRSAVSGQG